MKKISTLVILALLFVFSFLDTRAHASVSLRFWDDGVLVHRESESDNRGSRSLTYYYNESALKAAGKLSACPGYTFVGWRVGSPILNETADAAVAAVTSTVTISTTDIDLYAVYKKDTICYEKITSSSKLVADSTYLIVSSADGTNYYAMRGDDDAAAPSSIDIELAGLYGESVSVCDNGKIYPSNKNLIWKLGGSAGNWMWQNQGTTTNYLRVEAFVLPSRVLQMEKMLHYSSSTMKIEIAGSGVVTMKRESAYTGGTADARLSFAASVAASDDYFGAAQSNVFLVTDVNNANENLSGSEIEKDSVYLYRSAIESRYKSKSGAYTLQLKAVNNGSEDFSVTPSSLTEVAGSSSCQDLQTSSGVNPAGVSPTIGCTSRWAFAGWATTPCADRTAVAPTFVTANPYGLYRNNDTLYAVYSNKISSFYSSYPSCGPCTVTFHPCNGTVGGSSANQQLTEASAGAGITVPSAAFDCTGWSFAGWATEPVLNANSTPAGLRATGAYTPGANEDYYAVYTNSDRWTSYPVCSAGSVTLKAVTGTVDGNTTKTLTEAGADAGVTLIAATTSCTDVWKFAGWAHSLVAPTTDAPTVYASGSTYYPIHAADELYAVYYRGEVGSRVWTSSPVCEPYSVIFNACGSDGCDATVSGEASATVTEASIGAGITTPAPVVACSGRWTFAGWHKGSPIEHRFTAPDDLLASSASYMPMQNNEVFYAVYKQTSINYWSSNPDCDRYSATLHACEGTFAGGGNEQECEETSAGGGIVLPAATPLCASRGWTFVGWVEGGELNTTRDVAGLTIHEAGDTYIPIQDNTHLYAVYSIAGYKKVTTSDDLVAGDDYVIAFYWNYGTAYNYENFALSNQLHPDYKSVIEHLSLTPIEMFTDDSGNDFVISPGDTCIWVLGGNSSDGWTFRSKDDDKYVYSYDAFPDLKTISSSVLRGEYEINLTYNYIGLKDALLSYKYWHFQNIDLKTFHAYQADTQDDCYLYRAMGTIYSSWPHCAEYTVNFDGCDGEAETREVKETDAGWGVTVPGVTDICEGWTFAGWAEQPYEEQTGELTQNLYPEGTTYVPSKDNATLYAVYYKTKNTFDKIADASEMYAGVNYLVVYDNSLAMSNTLGVSSRTIASESVSPSSGTITDPAAKLQWRLLGYEGNYLWYNANADKYLNLNYLDDTYYANLTATAVDNFTISYVPGTGNEYFRVVSNNNKWLMLVEGGYFNSHEYTTDNTGITLYRQNADYCSYPCSTPVEPMRWGENSMIVESLTHSGAPTKGSVRITAISAGENGCYNITHSAKAGRKLRIGWGGNYYRMTVPFVASSTNTPAVEIQPTQHLVILKDARFVVNKETRLHQVTVYGGGELVIADGKALYVDTLVLRANAGEEYPSVTFGGEDAQLIISSGVVYHDLRLDDRVYYPMSLPCDARIAEIQYSGLIPAIAAPAKGTNYWIKYYDGVKRAEDANAGTHSTTYWKHVSADSIYGSIGYSIGIADNTIGSHIERTLRFKMTPATNWNNYEVNSADYVHHVKIRPSKVTDTNKKHNSGWNFIGNPYFHTYYPGEANGESGLLTGYIDVVDGKMIQVEDGVPYLTFYDVSAQDYYQTRANAASIKPFSTAFVQVEDYNVLVYSNPISTSDAISAPWRNTYKRENPVVKTGLRLMTAGSRDTDNAQRAYDETGLVISNRYTDAYEVGADLVKQFNPSYLHLYTMSSTHSLAFNALDERSAALPIQVGVSIPQTGAYTFRFDEWQYRRDALDALWLTDNETHTSTDLLTDSYTCTIQQGTNEQRFTLNAVLKLKDTPTDNASAVANGLHLISNEDGSVTLYSNDELTDLYVYDVAGRLIGEYAPNAGEWTMQLPQGVCVISVKSKNNPVTHLKVCTR